MSTLHVHYSVCSLYAMGFVINLGKHLHMCGGSMAHGFLFVKKTSLFGEIDRYRDILLSTLEIKYDQ